MGKKIKIFQKTEAGFDELIPVVECVDSTLNFEIQLTGYDSTSANPTIINHTGLSQTTVIKVPDANNYSENGIHLDLISGLSMNVKNRIIVDNSENIPQDSIYIYCHHDNSTVRPISAHFDPYLLLPNEVLIIEYYFTMFRGAKTLFLTALSVPIPQ